MAGRQRAADMNPDFAHDFPRQLRFWAFHVPLNALPSFIIGLYFQGRDRHKAFTSAGSPARLQR